MFGTGIYDGVLIVHGPLQRPYSVYFARQPQIRPEHYSISPAGGGRDDRALRVMPTSNLYP